MIKKIFFIIFLGVLVFLSTNATAEEGQAGYYRVTAVELNVRSDPDRNGRIITTVKAGEILFVSYFEGKWGRIDLGWVSGRHLRLVSDDLDEYRNNTTLVENQYYEKSNNSNPKINSSIVHNNSARSNAAVDVSLQDRFVMTVIVAIVAIYFVMLLIGMAEKVVVYFDEADLVISLMPWFILLIALILAGVYQYGENTPDRS